MGPTLSEEGWKRAFTESGWHKINLVHDRIASSIHATFLVSSPALPSTSLFTAPKWYIVRDTQNQVAPELLKSFEQNNPSVSVSIAEEDLSTIPDGASVVYLRSLDSPSIYEGISDAELQNMQTLVNKCSKVYWITSGGNMDVTKPQNSPLVGFSRVMKNEKPGLLSCVLDLDPAYDTSEVVSHIYMALHSTPLSEEAELVIRGKEGIVSIPRVSPKRVSADLQKRTIKKLKDSSVQLEARIPLFFS